ncbi:MAG TPA: zinc dependent phospholipase C family protein [Puia sp.]|jgi:hypothetical protein|nr:zinc dependent phospholipase C family protein [Puia sp.]
MRKKKIGIQVLIAIALVFEPQPSHAYSVLTHEAIVDACWVKSIEPLLLQKFPGATKDQLKLAHAYAYGGAIAPDIGYFPFGKPLFTNLVHYVRSGDFINALLDDAQDINEYAFALGFLCHYIADEYGHSLATNKCVPMLYPKERKKYGNVVTYEDDHLSHKRMEFAFDVLQTAGSDYNAVAYHDFIGFQFSTQLLERAFPEVYGIELSSIFPNLSLSVATLRWSFKRLFPSLTKAAWVLRKKEIQKARPEMTRRSYIYSMNKVDYYKEFGRKRQKPGIFSAVLGFFVWIVPKIGPLRSMKFKEPGPAAEKLFYASLDTTMVRYKAALRACRSGSSRLPNIDFDTGQPTTPGEYGLADKNYDILVGRLQQNGFKFLNGELKRNVIDFYSHRTAPTGRRKVMKAWFKTEEGLQQLRQAPAIVVN